MGYTKSITAGGVGIGVPDPAVLTVPPQAVPHL